MGTTFASDIPGAHVYSAPIDPVAAADVTEEQTIFVAPFNCVVTGVDIIPDAAVTGDATNTKNLNVIDKGSDGTGTTEIANKDLGAGVNLAANDVNAINAAALTTVMAAGDVLTLEVEKVGTGVAIPRSHVQVTYRPDNNPA